MSMHVPPASIQRTFPWRSITNVVRFWIRQSPSQTPQRLPTCPAGSMSLRSRTGSLSSFAQARFRSGASAETPTISVFSAANFPASSRNRENSVPQPEVNAFG